MGQVTFLIQAKRNLGDFQAGNTVSFPDVCYPKVEELIERFLSDVADLKEPSATFSLGEGENLMAQKQKTRGKGGKTIKMPKPKKNATYPRGFTLVELLVVILIILILAAILMPVLAKAKAKANSLACVSNLKQIGLALRQYMDDNNGGIPGNWLIMPGGPREVGCVVGTQVATWADLLAPYMGGSFELFMDKTSFQACGWSVGNPPMGLKPLNSSYIVNCLFDNDPAGQWTLWQHGKFEGDIPRPHATIYAFDGRGTQNSAGNNALSGSSNIKPIGGTFWRPIKRHMLGYNRLFLDGHVSWAKLIFPHEFNNSRFEDGGVWIAGTYYPEWTSGGGDPNPLIARAGDATPYN